MDRNHLFLLTLSDLVNESRFTTFKLLLGDAMQTEYVFLFRGFERKLLKLVLKLFATWKYVQAMLK